MHSSPVLLALLLVIQSVLHHHSVGVKATEDYPGGQDEEEVHVYKKYARYPLYYYVYRSPQVNEAAYQPQREWTSGLNPSETAENEALSNYESLPQRNIADKESFSKLQQVLLNDLDPEAVPEVRHNPAIASAGYMRQKKSSVSWLLAAAIRMCQKHPGECLRKDMQQGKMDLKGLVEGGRR